MKYVIVIDSVTALPEYVLEQRPIKILPVTITIDGKPQADTNVASELREIYINEIISTDSKIDTIPPTASEVSEFLLREVVPHYDYAICQTTAASSSPIYGAFASAASHIAKDSRQVRNKLGVEHPFMMSCVNTGTSNAGQGLVAMYADVVLSKGADYHAYKENVEKFKNLTKAYTVVKDILYTRNRAESLGIKFVGLTTAVVGQAIGVSPIVRYTKDVLEPVILKPGFEKAVSRVCKYAIERIREGLYLPIINISYAGDLDDLDGMVDFVKLRSVAVEYNVKLLVGMMSLCGCINYSPGSFSLGIAPKNQKIDPQ